MKEQPDSKSEPTDNQHGGKQFFNKKGKPKKMPRNNFPGEFFKGVAFCTGKEGPALYVRTIKRLGLYVETQFKNGYDVKECLEQEKVLKLEVPELAENHTVHEERVWEYHMRKLIKTERVLDGNLRNLFAILMSLCDSDTKNQVKCMTGYPELEKKLDSLGLLSLIKKLVYIGNMNDLDTSHSKAMAHMNLMKMYQKKFQDLREFRDQYLTMKKVCDELGLHFGRCEEEAKAILAEKGVMNPTQEQLAKALDDMEEEHHAIIFMYKVNRHKYGRLLEQMQNDMLLKKKDPFPKNIADAYRLLAGWKNQYGG